MGSRKSFFVYGILLSYAVSLVQTDNTTIIDDFSNSTSISTNLTTPVVPSGDVSNSTQDNSTIIYDVSNSTIDNTPNTTQAAPTTRKPSNICSGRGNCQCNSGYTGANCAKPLDWCNQRTVEINGKPIVKSICGNRGTCISSPAGAKCVCKEGFTGQLCDQLLPEALHLSRRCVAYNTYNSTGGQQNWAPQDQVGCISRQECVPDDLQCLLTQCDNPVGWCLPNERAHRGPIVHRETRQAMGDFFVSEDDFWGNSSDVCYGNGQCQCDYGYTGGNCEKEIDWCKLPAQGFNISTPLSKICGENGTCISQPSGATCVCQPGFTGQFCHEPIENEAFISRRCFAYLPYKRNLTIDDQEIPIGCGPGMACVPDNLQCLLAHCKNPIGWCLPLLEVDQERFNRLMTRFALIG